MADGKERENINQTKVMKVNGNRHEEEFRGVEADKLNGKYIYIYIYSSIILKVILGRAK